MKNNIKNFLLSTLMLTLACSFVSDKGTTSHEPVLNAMPVGGVHLVFAGKYGGKITKKEMDGETQLGVDGCARGSRIYQFTLDVTKNGKTTTLQAESNVLTREMLNRLKNLSPGDEFEFRKIKAYLPNGKDVVDVYSKKFIVA